MTVSVLSPYLLRVAYNHFDWSKIGSSPELLFNLGIQISKI